MSTYVDLHRKVLVGHLDLTSLCHAAQFGPMATAMVPFNNWGAGGYEEVKPGLKSSSFTADLYQDFAADVLDDEVGSALGTQYPVTQIPFPSGTVTVGDPGYFSRGILTTYGPLDGAHGEAAKARLSVKSDTVVVRGTVAHPSAARTTTGNGTIYALTGPTTSQRLYAALHVTDYSGLTNVVIKVQSDDGVGFGTPTDRLTLTTITGTTSQFSSVAGYGATETHHRIVYTLTGIGSVTFTVLLGVL